MFVVKDFFFNDANRKNDMKIGKGSSDFLIHLYKSE